LGLPLGRRNRRIEGPGREAASTTNIKAMVMVTGALQIGCQALLGGAEQPSGLPAPLAQLAVQMRQALQVR